MTSPWRSVGRSDTPQVPGRLTGGFAADPEAAKRRRAARADLVILGSDLVPPAPTS